MTCFDREYEMLEGAKSYLVTEMAVAQHITLNSYFTYSLDHVDVYIYAIEHLGDAIEFIYSADDSKSPESAEESGRIGHRVITAPALMSIVDNYIATGEYSKK